MKLDVDKDQQSIDKVISRLEDDLEEATGKLVPGTSHDPYGRCFARGVASGLSTAITLLKAFREELVQDVL